MKERKELRMILGFWFGMLFNEMGKVLWEKFGKGSFDYVSLRYLLDIWKERLGVIWMFEFGV